MAKNTLIGDATYLLAIAKTLRLAKRVGRTFRAAELRDAAALWAEEFTKSRKSQTNFQFTAMRWLDFLGRLKKQHPSSRSRVNLVAAWADHMRIERGLSPVTIDKRCWWVRRFLNRPDLPKGVLRKITIAHIDAAFVAMSSADGYARSTLKTRAIGLRSFFAFTETRGWSRPGLAAAIHMPRLYAQEALPAGPSWMQILTAMRKVTGDRPADIRAAAILALFAFYALRAKEVGQLRLEDIDWEAERFSITNDKAGRTRVYPLTRRVGDAVLRYLKQVRPRSPHREVFLTLRAPVRPLSSCCLWSIVATQMRALGANLSGYGPRSLRHACATHLLNTGGLSMKEVGDHLGHRDPDSTQIYAKVDLTSLRKIAALDLGGVMCD